MEDFFCTIYYYTNGFYSAELDDYLYSTVPGYLHIGLVMLIATVLICGFYYYLYKPVRNQTKWWFFYVLINAVVNFCFSMWYTMTPLINNEIDPQLEWTYLDCPFMSVTNVIWASVMFLVCSLVIKWWSPCKYVPFQKF